MTVEQIYTGCLAEAAYYIESNGEAAIIDPLRETGPYLERAAKDNAKIKYIFETHFHADFVSGHVDLAKKTGGTIVYGPTTMETGFDMLVGKDGQEFKIGDVTIKLIHTPGHTMESSCYLLTDENGKETALFSGDTLFIGDVGRPDLAQKVIAELTQEKLAGHLFDSLRNKIMPLNDDLIVYPGHGAGSACGKNMSKETSDTLGNQKQTNYALDPKMTKEEFIDAVLDGLTPPPGYFPQNVLLNIQGYESIDEVMDKGTQALSIRAFETLMAEDDVLVLDTRDPQVFARGFVPGSINIGIDGSFATWVGTLVPSVKQKILIVADPDRAEEVVARLARVGFDNAMGYLAGGFEGWQEALKPTDHIQTVDIAFLEKASQQAEFNLLDVRKASEFNSEHVVNALNTPLDYINDQLAKIDKNKTYYVHCRSGYRSMVFISILKNRGYQNLIDVKGGFEAIKENGGFELTEYVCPTTML